MLKINRNMLPYMGDICVCECVCVRCDLEHILCHLNVAQIIQLKEATLEETPRGAPGSCCLIIVVST